MAKSATRRSIIAIKKIPKRLGVKVVIPTMIQNNTIGSRTNSKGSSKQQAGIDIVAPTKDKRQLATCNLATWWQQRTRAKRQAPSTNSELAAGELVSTSDGG
jgi:hypothetical protein